MPSFLNSIGEGWLSPKYLGWLWDGWLMTLWASLVVTLGALAFGTLIAAVRESGRTVWVAATEVYLSVFRNTPLLVQLFFWYFGVPAVLPEGVLPWLNEVHALTVAGFEILRWPSFEFLAAIVGLIFYSSAYISEDIRSGLRGVPASQRAAAQALGFGPVQVLRYVVLPQAMRIATPALVGQVMNIVKNTSLGMAVGLLELSYRARQAEAESWKTFQVYGVATVLYIVAIALLEVMGHWLQRRQSRSLVR
ncbi:amino acid ABC transporter permease [Ottowia thiooxydans]|uniref:amino acid ABC transporter permease n=1 Tax=Ottowia thiooxydans TaxID=219182 RepID=UPI00048F0407|nr:amino acid ABC transporter permease [Ottowia thiooxydans]